MFSIETKHCLNLTVYQRPSSVYHNFCSSGFLKGNQCIWSFFFLYQLAVHTPEHKQINLIERVSIECRKTKTKVITLANQKGRRQSSKPIKLEVIPPTRSAGKCARASHDWFGFLFWLVKKNMARERLNQSLREVMQNQSNSLITFDTFYND